VIVHSLDAGKTMDKPALISLTFDDGLRCQFEHAVPILDQYGFLATFFLTANASPIHIDWHDHLDWRKIEWNADDIQLLKSVAQRGHEIGSHSVWHKFPNPDHPKFRSDFDPTFEAEESKRLIEGWMGMEIPSFCYPFCQKPDPLKNAVITAGYKQARAGANGSFCCPTQDPVDWFDLDCREISQNENVGAWIRSGCWHTLMFHGIGTEQDGWGHIPVLEFARQMGELAKLRDAGVVEVVTFKDGADRLRQSK
jgi:peptidoglycan/xylan/chitin deacetylase (PgdA/CDA1 family)